MLLNVQLSKNLIASTPVAAKDTIIPKLLPLVNAKSVTFNIVAPHISGY